MVEPASRFARVNRRPVSSSSLPLALLEAIGGPVFSLPLTSLEAIDEPVSSSSSLASLEAMGGPVFLLSLSLRSRQLVDRSLLFRLSLRLRLLVDHSPFLASRFASGN